MAVPRWLGALLAPGLGAIRSVGTPGKMALLGLPCVAITMLATLRELERGSATDILVLYAVAGATAAYFAFAYFVETRSALRRVESIVLAMRQGDLTQVVSVDGRDEIAVITQALDAVNNTLSGLVAGIRSDAVVVSQAGQSLAVAASDLASRTERQAATLEQTNASVQELSDTVRSNADEAVSVEKMAANVHAIADAGGNRMRDAVTAMRAIKDGATRVHDIISVIKGIAFQTNILALNAAVEAARAGEHGRGFAVVASEVRALALRSSQAAQEVRTLIAASTQQVESGVNHIDEVSEMLVRIVGGVGQLASNMQSITSAATQQSAALLQITQAVGGLDEITQQNAHMVERSSADSTELGDRAGRLAKSVDGFRLRQGTADEAFALVQAAQALFHEKGRAALAEITDSAGGFCDRDMYAFAWDRSLVYHAFAGKPANVGKLASEVIGTDVTQLAREVWAAAARGGGWVDYDFRNPITGQIAPKTSYIVGVGVGVGDELVLGCGIYKTLQSN